MNYAFGKRNVAVERRRKEKSGRGSFSQFFFVFKSQIYPYSYNTFLYLIFSFFERALMKNKNI